MTTKNLIKWDPFHEMRTFHEDMNRMFSEFLGRVPSQRALTEGLWVPLADLEETKDEMVVKVEIPGLAKEDLKIKIAKDALTISGERQHQDESKDKTYHRIERTYGKFLRVIDLPAEVESTQGKATYEDGVLTIHLPKARTVQPHELTVEGK